MVVKGGPFTRGRQGRGYTVWKRPEMKAQLHQGWTQAPLEISKIMPKFRKGSQKNVKKDTHGLYSETTNVLKIMYT